jgi:AcrR family transcriptional regulator
VSRDPLTRIISAAETLFNKQGFDGASMRDIAAAAEMQAASVYYYFESKEELRFPCVARDPSCWRSH